MSCYHPLIRQLAFDIPDYELREMREYGVVPENGRAKKEYDYNSGEWKDKYVIRAMQPGEYDLWRQENMSWLKQYMTVIPCGHCIGCKLDHSRQWADRMLCELQSANGKGIFITLTYEQPPLSSYQDNNGIDHKNYTLNKKDLQRFLKRLRRKFDGTGKFVFVDKEGQKSKILLPERKIRFYAAGEYGSMTLRPHYHAIVFGLSIEDVFGYQELNAIGEPVKNDMGDLYYRSDLLSDIWKAGKSKDSMKGFVSVGACTWKSCAYVARYVTKKWQSGYNEINKNGKKIDLYKFFNVEPEFSEMSLKPGIGTDFFESWTKDHEDFCMLDFKNLSISDENGGKTFAIPKYFRRKFKDAPEHVLRMKYEEYTKRAIQSAESRIALELDKTDREYIEYLSVKEAAHADGAKKLRRDKV